MGKHPVLHAFRMKRMLQTGSGDERRILLAYVARRGGGPLSC